MHLTATNDAEHLQSTGKCVILLWISTIHVVDELAHTFSQFEIIEHSLTPAKLLLSWAFYF